MYAVRETDGLKIDDGFIAIDLKLPNLYSREGSASALVVIKLAQRPRSTIVVNSCQGANQNPDNPDSRETRGTQKMSPRAFCTGSTVQARWGPGVALEAL